MIKRGDMVARVKEDNTVEHALLWDIIRYDENGDATENLNREPTFLLVSGGTVGPTASMVHAEGWTKLEL